MQENTQDTFVVQPIILLYKEIMLNMLLKPLILPVTEQVIPCGTKIIPWMWGLMGISPCLGGNIHK